MNTKAKVLLLLLGAMPAMGFAPVGLWETGWGEAHSFMTTDHSGAGDQEYLVEDGRIHDTAHDGNTTAVVGPGFTLTVYEGKNGTGFGETLKERVYRDLDQAHFIRNGQTLNWNDRVHSYKVTHVDHGDKNCFQADCILNNENHLTANFRTYDEASDWLTAHQKSAHSSGVLSKRIQHNY